VLAGGVGRGSRRGDTLWRREDGDTGILGRCIVNDDSIGVQRWLRLGQTCGNIRRTPRGCARRGGRAKFSTASLPAPGGYLLQAYLATGMAAGRGVLACLGELRRL